MAENDDDGAMNVVAYVGALIVLVLVLGVAGAVLYRVATLLGVL